MVRVELETDWKNSISIKSYNEQTLFSVSKKKKRRKRKDRGNSREFRSHVKYIISEFRIEIFSAKNVSVYLIFPRFQSYFLKAQILEKST